MYVCVYVCVCVCVCMYSVQRAPMEAILKQTAGRGSGDHPEIDVDRFSLRTCGESRCVCVCGCGCVCCALLSSLEVGGRCVWWGVWGVVGGEGGGGGGGSV